VVAQALAREARDIGAPALLVEGLSVSVGAGAARLELVADVSLRCDPGQVTAVIGESGSGKSLTASAVLGLLDRRVYHVEARRLQAADVDLTSLTEADFARVRGLRAGYVMQDPATALDPTMTVADQIAEIFVAHRGQDWTSARREAVRMLDLVRIPSAASRALDYPHAFSGGMRQRVVIAGAVALSPRLLVADEPTTALDVTVQAEILALIDELRRTMGMSVLLITHDLGIVYQVADRVAVMYAGRVVEEGATEPICRRPAHPYTAGLLASVPDLDAGGEAVAAIPGAPPTFGAMIGGCAFEPRCGRPVPACAVAVPPFVGPVRGSRVRCNNPLPAAAGHG
jgi:oligopeptide/dipeptide ABC transporter ATP-binding protein